MTFGCVQSQTKDKDIKNSYTKILIEGIGKRFQAFNQVRMNKGRMGNAKYGKDDAFFFF